jgi:DNA-binding response OmpR family regulator
VVEDERDLADLVAVGLRRHAMAVGVAYDGAAAVERVAGLGMGADDYLPKPFDYAEPVTRVRALGRRSRPQCTSFRR